MLVSAISITVLFSLLPFYINHFFSGISVICILFPYYLFTKEAKHNFTFGSKMFLMLAVVAAIVGFWTTIHLFRNQRKFLETLNALNEADLLLKRLDLRFSARILCTTAFIVMVQSGLGSAGAFLYQIIFIKQNILDALIHTIAYISAFSHRMYPMFYMYGITTMIYVRLWHLNARLKKMDCRRISEDELRKELHLFCKIFHLLCEAAKCLNDSLSVLVLGVFLASSQQIIMTSFCALGIMKERQAEVYCGLFTNGIPVYFITITCYYCSFEVCSHDYFYSKLIKI